MAKLRLYIEANSVVPTKRSGIGHFTLELLREFDKEKYSHIDVIAYGCLGEQKALERHGFSRVQIKILPFPHKVLSLLSRMSLRLPIDLYLGRGIYLFPNFRNLYVSRLSKSFTYIHDVSFKIFPEYTQPENLRYILNNITRWVGRTDRIVTISTQSKKEIVSELGIPESKILVTPLGVNPEVFYPRSEDEVLEISKDVGVEPKKYFLFVGNIEPRKNLEFLVRSFASSERLKPYTLLIVGGDGWLNENIHSAIEEARKAGFRIVRNKKYIDDDSLPALMTGSLGLIMPSRHEGFGLPIVQALACGVPVIASDIAVMRETADNRASYFTLGDPEDLSRLLEAKITPQDSKAYVVTTWSEYAQNLVEILESEKTKTT